MQSQKEDKESISDVYFSKIVPKIKEIDIILKEGKVLNKEFVSKLLDIPEKELIHIMKKMNINKIEPANFLPIMINGSSFICQILKREIECGSPHFYSPKEISYIYDVNEEKVSNAFKFLDLEFVTTSQIPTILIQIN